MRKVIILIIAGVVFFTSGCQNIRKKFIRKKKAKADAPVYVDFKDYPERPSRDAYIDYSLFVRGWLDEFSQALGDSAISGSGNYKRARRAINEAVMNLEQIISFYTPQGKDKIYPLYEQALSIKKEVNNNPNMSNLIKNSFRRKAEGIRRRFEKEFNYTDAEKWLK
ncbi:MAG: hypothetical protein PHU64_02565 [Candidatus Omnitrophica bacterium]|nr:hypothetical protein [Candidatus Omnitrophota bacterium]MDD5429400.1 hypothetical protein [Candidatus Omnitrophota bacterium]